jgi:Leucine-rich repeat (LRR) protein
MVVEINVDKVDLKNNHHTQLSKSHINLSNIRNIYISEKKLTKIPVSNLGFWCKNMRGHSSQFETAD